MRKTPNILFGQRKLLINDFFFVAREEVLDTRLNKNSQSQHQNHDEASAYFIYNKDC